MDFSLILCGEKNFYRTVIVCNPKYAGHGANFDWLHLVVMLYAVVKRFDSLREIVASMLPEARKLGHLGINSMPRRSTLSDANLRRNECIFEAIYRELYATYKHVLSAKMSTFVHGYHVLC